MPNPLQDPKVQMAAAVLGALAAATMKLTKPHTIAHKWASWITVTLGGVLGTAVMTK